MPISDAKKRSNKKWNDANKPLRYDRVQLLLPKGKRDIIHRIAQITNESLNVYISRAILARIGADTWADVPAPSDDAPPDVDI